MAIDKRRNGLSLLRPRKEQKPIFMENGITIFPITIGEIEELGEEKYYRLLNLLTIDIKQVEMFLLDEKMKDLVKTPFHLLVMYCLMQNTKELVLESLSLFLKNKITFISEKEVFAIGDVGDVKFLHNGNFNEFQSILQFQNCIKKDEHEIFNPKNKKAKEIKDKLEKAKKAVNKYKKTEEEDPLTLEDLVSILSSSGNENGINLFNVWDLNMYQFNNQFSRMKMMEDYDVNIRQVLAGVDPKKLELKHWMSKIV